MVLFRQNMSFMPVHNMRLFMVVTNALRETGIDTGVHTTPWLYMGYQSLIAMKAAYLSKQYKIV